MAELKLLEPADFQPLLKAGWWARGASYVGVGLLALLVAYGQVFAAEDADQAGAVELVADAPGGTFLLVLLAIGFALFATWEAIAFVITDQDGVDVVLLRVGKVVGVVVYGTLAWTSGKLAWKSLMGSPTAQGKERWTVEAVTADVLGHSLGRVAVGIAALVVLIVAARRLQRVRTGEFSDDLQLHDSSERAEWLIDRLGRVGEIGRSLSFVLISYFLAHAAWDGQSSEARGLDRSLREAAESGIGRVAVAVVGVGMIAYGIFCAASAHYRDLRRT